MIALTGVTGELGSRVRARLAAAGEDVRLVVRRPGAATTSGNEEMRVASDYTDTAAMTAALHGCSTLFLVSAREAPDRVTAHLSAVAAAAEAGVDHIVYTSFQGAAPDCTFTFGRDHWHTEQAIEATGMEFVFLRDNFYLAGLVGMVGSDLAIRGPAGTGSVAAVAHDDVADVAAACLTSDLWWGQTLEVSGPEALTLSQAAATISDRSGRPVRYVPETEDEAYASRAQFNAPDFAVAGWVSSYQAIATGEVATVSDTVPRVLGRPAQDLGDFLETHPQLLDPLRG